MSRAASSTSWTMAGMLGRSTPAVAGGPGHLIQGSRVEFAGRGAFFPEPVASGKVCSK